MRTKSLEKYVAVTRGGTWFDMHVHAADAIALCQRHDSLVEVQVWRFNELPDGSHTPPEKKTFWIKPLTD